MNKENTEYLIKNFWFFQPDPTLRNNLMAFGFECDDGWFNLIKELCEKLEKLIDEKYPDLKEVPDYNKHIGFTAFYVCQVKEKFGMLCFYVSSAYDEIFDLIQEYEKLSYETCEICGEKGETLVNYFGKGHWYKTLCPKHAEELQYAERVKD
jgi:hypothetical protein